MNTQIATSVVPSPNTTTASPRRRLTQPAFIAAAIVLLIAALGLNGAVEYLRLHFKKLPVELRHPLTELPSTLNRWVQVSKDKPLDKEMEENLQTKEYMFRDYVDSGALGMTPAALREKFENKNSAEREEEVGKIRAKNPEAVVLLAITHYTGKADTVAHIPERCYTADGYTERDASTEKWKKEVRYVTFEGLSDTLSGGRLCHVAYAFQVNGAWTSSSDDVRRTLQDLTCKHAYYSKIELMSSMRDRDGAARVMQRFFDATLPELEKLLPNWDEYKNR